MRHQLPIVAILVTGILGLSSVPSLADRAAADACAAGLSADSKLIYDATIASVQPNIVLKDVIRAKTRALVMDSKISRGKAQAAAEAAGACLKQAL